MDGFDYSGCMDNNKTMLRNVSLCSEQISSLEDYRDGLDENIRSVERLIDRRRDEEAQKRAEETKRKAEEAEWQKAEKVRQEQLAQYNRTLETRIDEYLATLYLTDGNYAQPYFQNYSWHLTRDETYDDQLKEAITIFEGNPIESVNGSLATDSYGNSVKHGFFLYYFNDNDELTAFGTLYLYDNYDATQEIYDITYTYQYLYPNWQGDGIYFTFNDELIDIVVQTSFNIPTRLYYFAFSPGTPSAERDRIIHLMDDHINRFFQY